MIYCLHQSEDVAFCFWLCIVLFLEFTSLWLNLLLCHVPITNEGLVHLLCYSSLK